MVKFLLSLLKLACITSLFLLLACSPKHDWREVRGSTTPFVILMPAKAATHAREINLDGTQITMTMTATEVDDVTFAVGTAELANAAKAQTALIAIKTALIKNISGTLKHEKFSAIKDGQTMIEIEASSAPEQNGGSQSRLLLARFIAKDKRVYQLLVVGKQKKISRDAADTFFTSFKSG